MVQQGLDSLRIPLPRPRRGQSSRIRCGKLELVLESVRGGHVLVSHDGVDGRRWSLGLGDGAQLALVLKVPSYPLGVATRETLALTPGGRVRGYVQVPLVPTVMCWNEDGGEAALIELLPKGLAAEWEERGGFVQRWVSPFLHRLPQAGEELVAVVPVWVRSLAAEPLGLGEIPIALRNEELREQRGLVFAAPRRIAVRSDGAILVSARAQRAGVLA
jgi:hypothetical protein